MLLKYRLSVSKWIHLNNGDEGLLAFFRRVFSVLRPGGSFILEPQEWESYHKAKRMDPVCIPIQKVLNPADSNCTPSLFSPAKSVTEAKANG